MKKYESMKNLEDFEKQNLKIGNLKNSRTKKTKNANRKLNFFSQIEVFILYFFIYTFLFSAFRGKFILNTPPCLIQYFSDFQHCPLTDEHTDIHLKKQT